MRIGARAKSSNPTALSVPFSAPRFADAARVGANFDLTTGIGSNFRCRGGLPQGRCRGDRELGQPQPSGDGVGPRYQFINDVFCFGYGGAVSGSGVSVPNDRLHYIAERHAPGEAIATGQMSLATKLDDDFPLDHTLFAPIIVAD